MNLQNLRTIERRANALAQVCWSILQVMERDYRSNDLMLEMDLDAIKYAVIELVHSHRR